MKKPLVICAMIIAMIVGGLSIPCRAQCRVVVTGDLNSDCMVNSLDILIMADSWLRTDCLAPADCNDSDIAPIGLDGMIDYQDIAAMSAIWLQDNITPDPDKPLWLSDPVATSPYTAEMTAADVFDESGIEYFFQNTTDSTHSSGWQSSPFWEDRRLDPDTIYAYEVKARDLSNNYNETLYSDPLVAVTDPGIPLLGNVYWAQEPNSVGAYTIIMTAQVSDPNVEYSFENLTDPNFDSGWQNSPFYENADLTPETEYSYRFRARNIFINQNESEYSSVISVTTLSELKFHTAYIKSIALHDGRLAGTDSGPHHLSTPPNTNNTPRALRLGGVSTFGYGLVVSFNTLRRLPTNCIIESAALELTCGYTLSVGEDPFLPGSWAGSCNIDVASAFSGNKYWQETDWDAAADATAIASFDPGAAPATGEAIKSTYFNQQGLDNLNLNGLTQFRARFAVPTHSTTSYVGFYAGESSDYAPRLIINYYDTEIYD